MRLTAVVLGVLTLAPAAAAVAQVEVHLHLGAAVSSDLVRDSILQAITVGPNPAIVIGAGFTAPLSDPWRAGAAAQVGDSDLMVRDAEGERRIVPLRVWQGRVLLERTIAGPVAAEASVGVLIYDPEFTGATLFQDGTPRPLTWGVGARADLPLAGDWVGAVRARWDTHQFTTNRLRVEGFIDERFVHRFTVGITLGRRYGEDDR